MAMHNSFMLKTRVKLESPWDEVEFPGTAKATAQLTLTRAEQISNILTPYGICTFSSRVDGNLQFKGVAVASFHDGSATNFELSNTAEYTVALLPVIEKAKYKGPNLVFYVENGEPFDSKSFNDVVFKEFIRHLAPLQDWFKVSRLSLTIEKGFCVKVLAHTTIKAWNTEVERIYLLHCESNCAIDKAIATLAASITHDVQFSAQSYGDIKRGYSLKPVSKVIEVCRDKLGDSNAPNSGDHLTDARWSVFAYANTVAYQGLKAKGIIGIAFFIHKKSLKFYFADAEDSYVEVQLKNTSINTAISAIVQFANSETVAKQGFVLPVFAKPPVAEVEVSANTTDHAKHWAERFTFHLDRLKAEALPTLLVQACSEVQKELNDELAKHNR